MPSPLVSSLVLSDLRVSVRLLAMIGFRGSSKFIALVYCRSTSVASFSSLISLNSSDLETTSGY